MGLSIVNNNASLNAQQSLNKTSGNLNKALERLSSGLKVNRGADGPAALVISEQQRAQIAGLKTAIDNTNKAVSVVQTGEGALNEVNSLLTKVRGLALDSANSGVNDSNALAANQAEIANSLKTIDTIAKNTKFGSKNLLDGSAAISGTISGTNGVNASAVKTTSSTAAGQYVATINTAGSGGDVLAAAVGAGSMTSTGSLNISGGGLTGQVGVALDIGDDVNTAATKIQKALDDSTSQGGGKGKFAVSVTAGRIEIQSKVLGSANVVVGVNGAAGAGGTSTVTGFSSGGADTNTSATGGTALTVNVSFNGATAVTVAATAGASGLNNEIKYGGSTGLTFSVGVSAAGATTAAATTSTINVADNSLTFQIGANANETAKISFDKVTSDALAVGVSGLSNANTTDLSKIDVTTQNGAQDAIKVVDAAISQVSNLRGALGAFQSNTLESNARNLSATLENTTAAESVIRDTDFASEIANFTRLQTQQQAGSTVLGNANQTTQLVAQLLRG